MANVTIGSSQAISSTTVTKPSGVVDGSVLVVRYHWFCAGDQHLNSPTMSDGFVNISNLSFYNTGHTYSYGVAIFRKVITNAAGEPSTYTITPVTGRDLDAGQIDRLVNCDTTTPERDTGQNGLDFAQGTPWSTGAAIDSLAEDLLLIGVTAWAATVATPGGMVRDYLQDPGGATGDVAGFSENPGVLSGGTRTANTGANDGSGTAFVVFRAASGATPDLNALIGEPISGSGVLN